MSILQPIRRAIGKGKQPRYKIQQHCMRCNTVLAFELSDRLGSRASSEAWVNKGGIFVRERWYGNFTTCPKCGLSGRLPGDKPLSAESILTKTEDVVAMDKQITKHLEEKKRGVKNEKLSDEKNRPVKDRNNTDGVC